MSEAIEEMGSPSFSEHSSDLLVQQKHCRYSSGQQVAPFNTSFHLIPNLKTFDRQFTMRKIISFACKLAPRSLKVKSAMSLYPNKSS